MGFCRKRGQHQWKSNKTGDNVRIIETEEKGFCLLLL